MSNELKCPICGEPTRVYMGNARKDKLCGKHADMLKAGEIEYDSLLGIYYDSNGYEIDTIYNKADKKEQNNKNNLEIKNQCTICGTNSNGKEVCTDCYKEIMSEYDELDKNQKKWELKDYYYNLKSNIGRLKSYQYVINNTYRLFAIAWAVKWNCKDDQLSDVVAEDVRKLLKNKEKLKEKQTDEKDAQTDRAIIAATDINKNRAIDGHICKSAGEVLIDNILYRNHVCHAYEKNVKEIDIETDRTVVSDWYIPLTGTKGIYIEYWGMDKKDYQDNKEEKIALYQKHNLKLIEINKNDINSEDLLEDNLYRQLRKFGWKPQED